ncbi:MAG: transcriptional regulator [Eubacterium sp.]|nr:transcriptional regulator [Eubacterium sp.]
MAFDYKKEYKEFYLPPKKPQIIEIPAMNFVSVCGRGDPNEPDGAYQRAIQILYGIAFTIKMSCKGAHKIDGYFSYVVPPLEGLWQQEGIFELDTFRKEDFQWRSMIRLPDFVEKKDFDWAVKEAEAKKKTDFSAAEFFAYEEGLCVQCMHIGSYDDEPETIRRMDNFAREAGYQIDVSGGRMHHEIYLSDPRRTNVERLRTVVRHPVTRMTERVK